MREEMAAIVSEALQLSARRKQQKEWLKQLKAAHVALALLRGQIRGNDPAQAAMSQKLLEAMAILDTHIKVEGELAK